MRVAYGEGLASHTSPESCGGDRKVVVEALTGERAGRVSSLEYLMVRGTDAVLSGGRQQWAVRHCEDRSYSAWLKTPCTRRNISLGRRSLPREGRLHFLSDGSREIPGSARKDFDEFSRVVFRGAQRGGSNGTSLESLKGGPPLPSPLAPRRGNLPAGWVGGSASRSRRGCRRWCTPP
jgi:hypothetical protein